MAFEFLLKHPNQSLISFMPIKEVLSLVSLLATEEIENQGDGVFVFWSGWARRC